MSKSKEGLHGVLLPKAIAAEPGQHAGLGRRIGKCDLAKGDNKDGGDLLNVCGLGIS